MKRLVLAALLAWPAERAAAWPPAVPVPAPRPAVDPLPRGSRVLVLNPALAPVALEELAAARGWKVDSAPAVSPAVVAARAGRPKLLVVSAGLLDAQRLSALRGAAAGAKLILTARKGEPLPELPEQVAFEVLEAPYEAAALAEAVTRAFTPRPPPSAEDRQRQLEQRAAQKERKDLARRIASLTVDRILAMAEPLEGESAALEQLLERVRKKAAAAPERLTPPEQDLLLVAAALELGLDGYATRPEGDRANDAVQAMRRVGFAEEAAALEEAGKLLARHGRQGRAVDRLQAREALGAKERARWGELSAVLDRARAGPGRERATHQLLEYARAQRKALRLDGRPASIATADGAAVTAEQR